MRWWTAMRKNAAHSSSQAVHPAAALQQAASDWCSEGVHNPSCACAVAALATDATSTAAVKPPGLDVLLDLLGKLFTFGLSAPASSLPKANFSAPFLHHASQQCTSLAALTFDWPICAGERNVLRAAMVTTLIEVDRLAFERHSAPFGTWRLQKPAAAWTFRLPELCSTFEAQCLCANSPLGLRMRVFNLATPARLSSSQVLPRRRRCWPRCDCCAALWSRTWSLSLPCGRPRTLVCHRMHVIMERDVADLVLPSIAPPPELPSRLWHFGLRRHVIAPFTDSTASLTVLYLQPLTRPLTWCYATIASASPCCWILCGTRTTRRYKQRQCALPHTSAVSMGSAYIASRAMLMYPCIASGCSGDCQLCQFQGLE